MRVLLILMRNSIKVMQCVRWEAEVLNIESNFPIHSQVTKWDSTDIIVDRTW
jgi:hypothetical protein